MRDAVGHCWPFLGPNKAFPMVSEAEPTNRRFEETASAQLAKILRFEREGYALNRAASDRIDALDALVASAWRRSRPGRPQASYWRRQGLLAGQARHRLLYGEPGFSYRVRVAYCPEPPPLRIRND